MARTPRRDAPTQGDAWGLRLTSGDTCVFVTGATDVVAGERLNYACAKDGWIIGAPDRSTVTWTAQSVEWPKTHVTLVRLRRQYSNDARRSRLRRRHSIVGVVHLQGSGRAAFLSFWKLRPYEETRLRKRPAVSLRLP